MVSRLRQSSCLLTSSLWRNILRGKSTTSRNDTSPDSAHEKPNRGMPLYTASAQRFARWDSHRSLRLSAGSLLLTSSIIHLQLFFTHTTGHTPPISQKTSEPKVHEVSRNSRIVWCIEPSSHFLIIFLFCMLLCHSIQSLYEFNFT